MKPILALRHLVLLSVSLATAATAAACGDDDDDQAEETGSSGKGGSGGSKATAGSGGSKATAGSGGSKAAAGSGGKASTDAGAAGNGEDGGTSSGTHEVPCTDQSVSQLMLLDAPSDAAIKEEGTTDGVFETFIDATGGGLQTTKSYTYARFTEQGLERVEVSDEEAFTSTDWEIGFRRYVIRLNSGVSGPGNVTGARTKDMTTFDGLESVPDGLQYRTEEYFTESCDFVPDTSGIGAPVTALSSYWSYSSCLAMTHVVYVIALPSERHVKLEVISYYTPENQTKCDETGMVPMPTGAGNIRIKWAFLD